MNSCMRCLLVLFFIAAVPFTAGAQESALLFRLSGDGPGDGFTADEAFGDPEPAYLNEYGIVPDGAKGRAFRAPHSEGKLMTWLAPGNIFAQRGTLSFFVRMRDPVGGMPFKLFYVSYCDHSSLDMTWLRVDYNGERGFDAFVTDANMARVRVRYIPGRFPEPDEWTHIAFAWDEAAGVRLYMNGELVAKRDTSAVFDAGLGLFQPFGRFATPGTVTSNCGHLRGGDIDEIHIYGCMLNGEQVGRLARGETVRDAAFPVRSLADSAYRNEWLYRYGWDRPDAMPPALDGSTTWSVRKVEIHDARDQKKWTWRSNDGIRETTWPNAYNRSHLPGRSDYFIEPDWYCYSTSGKAISYAMPEEPWNYCEITGAAFGRASHILLDTERRTHAEHELFTRPAGRERTFHLLDEPRSGGVIRFVNEVRETPLAEFGVYHVAPGREPEGLVTLEYTVADADEPENLSLTELREYFRKRLPADERDFVLALPARAPRSPKAETAVKHLPVVHVLIPYQFRDEGPRTNRGAYAGFHYTWDRIYAGLDGIAIDLPPLNFAPTHGGRVPVNIKIRDPLWPNRAMADVSFSVRPDEPKTIWFDTRDRILPEGRSFCIDIASASPEFGPQAIGGAKVRLVFKKRADALAEHEIDRFTQMRDNFGPNMTETRPQRTKLEFLQRFNRDMGDLLRVNPAHDPGRHYWNWWNPEQNTLPVELANPPDGVPLWAFRQTELLKQWRYYLDWWIDNRQIDNGEFGGGLSDDGDFANCMPPFALIGVIPEKITDSVHRLMDAYYENGMFTDGLNTILTDALHATEEGINVQPEVMLLEYGDPKIVERMFETASRYRDITGINSAGHRHFPSSFFGASKMATEYPWCWSSRFSHTFLAPGMTLVEFNGHPGILKIVREVGDGILAHAQKDANGRTVLPLEINYLTDEARSFSAGTASQLFRALHRWTGDDSYIAHLGGPSRRKEHPQTDKEALAASYAATARLNKKRMYIATEGFPWDDGPYISSGGIIPDRLGGWPIRRGNQFPEHAVGWSFEKPRDATSLAVLVPGPTRTSVKIVAYNLERDPVKASVVGWGVDPGTWEVTEGIDTNGDDLPDGKTRTRTVAFERSETVSFTFPPGKTTIVRMTLKKKGTPYWKRPDLGIGRDDVTVRGNAVSVVVHSLGSVDAPTCPVALVDGSGRIVSTAEIPPLRAPLDYRPKTC